MRSEEEIRKVYEVAQKEYERVRLIDQFYTEKVAQECNILGWVLNDNGGEVMTGTFNRGGAKITMTGGKKP